MIKRQVDAGDRRLQSHLSDQYVSDNLEESK